MSMYVIMTRVIDKKNGNVRREYTRPLWDSAKEAHDYAKAHGLHDYCVFPDTSYMQGVSGIDAMARAMTRTACSLLRDHINRGTSYALDLLDRIILGTLDPFISDHDTADCVQAATAAIWEGILQDVDIYTQSSMALSAVYHYIRSERAYFNGRKAPNISIEQMTDEAMQNEGLVIEDIAESLMLEDERNGHRQNAPSLLKCANIRMSAPVRAVVILYASGKTQAQAARILGKNESTISRNMQRARSIMAAYMREMGMPYPNGITDADVDRVIEEASYRTRDRRTEESAARRREATRERVRAYRARKRAEMGGDAVNRAIRSRQTQNEGGMSEIRPKKRPEISPLQKMEFDG